MGARLPKRGRRGGPAQERQEGNPGSGRGGRFKLLDFLKDDYLYIPTLIAVTTGLRLGEVLDLTWGDVDFKRKVITVNQVQKLKKVKGGENVLDTGRPAQGGEKRRQY